MNIDDYLYEVTWSEEDNTFIGRVKEFPLLAAHGSTTEEAFKEIKFVVKCVIEDLKENDESIPKPLKYR